MKKLIYLCGSWLALSLTLASCQQDAEPKKPLQEEQHSKASVSLSFDSEIEELDASSAPRALTYTLQERTGKHPAIALKLTQGTRLATTLVFYNKRSRQSFRTTNAQWQYDADSKKLKIEKLDLSSVAPQDLRQNTQDWYMLTIIGGTPKGNDLGFAAGNAIPISRVSEAEMEGIYMSKAWTPLTLKWDNVENTMYISPQALGQEASQVVRLQNRCMYLMCRISPNKLGREVKVQGFRIATSGLSFSGTFDLSNLDGERLPDYKADSGANVYIARTDGTEQVAADQPSMHYACVAVPTSTTSNLRISPIIGESWNAAFELQYNDFRDKAIRSHAYVGINNLASKPKRLEHPIEGLLAWNNADGDAAAVSNGNAQTAIKKEEEVTDAGHFRTYTLPSIYQLSVLVPGMKGGQSSGLGSLGNNARAILDYRLGRFHDTKKSGINNMEGSAIREIEKEKLFVWGKGNGHEDYLEFDGIFEHRGRSKQDVKHFGNTYYAIRYIGHGNEYLSAYRYERDGDALKITVRTLGPDRAGTTINDVKNPNFWTKPLEWNQREYRRKLGQGVYWSRTTEMRGLFGQLNAGAVKTKVYHTMKIFATTSDDQALAQPDGAFVTFATRTWYLEDPNKNKNKHKYSLLFTTDREGRPKSL